VDHLHVGGGSEGQLAIASAGNVHVANQYTQAANGTLQLELGEGEFGSLSVAGDAVVDGQLAVTMTEAFGPELNQTFALITATGQLTGMFVEVQLPALATGLGWKLDYLPNAVLLEVILAGDFNGDGAVNLGDYTLWRDALGSTTDLTADANADRVVDATDYAIWKSHFGLSVSDFYGTASNSSQVPEPSAVWLLAAVLCAGVYSRRIVLNSTGGNRKQ
jgi:hypothetical protein